MEWDDTRSIWSCTFQNTITGKVTIREAAVVISAVGTLDRPAIPVIPGAQDFKGKAFHSARWDSSVSLSGKKVVVLGNGASATQFVPTLVQQVGPKGQVTQLVKSAHWWTKRVSRIRSALPAVSNISIRATLNIPSSLSWQCSIFP